MPPNDELVRSVSGFHKLSNIGGEFSYGHFRGPAIFLPEIARAFRYFKLHRCCNSPELVGTVREYLAEPAGISNPDAVEVSNATAEKVEVQIHVFVDPKHRESNQCV